jgi:cysteine desulfurase
MAIYLDYAATTPVDARVVAAMAPYWGVDGAFGNPSSQHAFGRQARAAVEEARRHVAALVGAEPSWVIFTSGATEADNLALRGLLPATGRRHLVVGAAEHHAVLHAADQLRQEGYEVDVLPVDEEGQPQVGRLPEFLRADTGLVSLMAGNNEVGALTDLAAAIACAHAVGALVHSDAVQAAGYLPLDMKELGLDALSLSAHKIYGPKGVGALVVRSGVRLAPLVVGGAQERGRRAGTENVPAIVGFGAAAALARAEREGRAEQARALSARLEELLLSIPGARRNGPPLARRLPHIVNVRFADVDGESLLLSLDLEGVAASSGSACASGSLSPSHVLLAMGLSEAEASSAVRFSVGWWTSQGEVEEAAAKAAAVVARIRKVLAPARRGGGGAV